MKSVEQQFAIERAGAEQKIRAALLALVVEALKQIEQAQILAYTRNANPPRLAYERTFTLRSASRTQITDAELPSIAGQWWADEGVAHYAEEVLGPRTRQKPIHQDRWKSSEQVANEAQQWTDREGQQFVFNRLKRSR